MYFFISLLFLLDEEKKLSHFSALVAPSVSITDNSHSIKITTGKNGIWLDDTIFSLLLCIIFDIIRLVCFPQKKKTFRIHTKLLIWKEETGCQEKKAGLMRLSAESCSGYFLQSIMHIVWSITQAKSWIFFLLLRVISLLGLLHYWDRGRKKT